MLSEVKVSCCEVRRVCFVVVDVLIARLSRM